MWLMRPDIAAARSPASGTPRMSQASTGPDWASRRGSVRAPARPGREREQGSDEQQSSHGTPQREVDWTRRAGVSCSGARLEEKDTRCGLLASLGAGLALRASRGLLAALGAGHTPRFAKRTPAASKAAACSRSEPCCASSPADEAEPAVNHPGVLQRASSDVQFTITRVAGTCASGRPTIRETLTV